MYKKSIEETSVEDKIAEIKDKKLYKLFRITTNVLKMQ